MIIAKYIFDKSIYENFIPVFNDGYSDYTISDEINENLVTRTIESDSLPTLMRFGLLYVNGENYDTDKIPHTSLIEVLDINTNNVTNMISMFRGCENLTSINCSFNTSKVISMGTMFQNCYNLTSLDVSNFNTSEVTSMYAMFYNCYNLTSLDVSNFNTSKVTRIDNMFRSCNKLTSLDLSNFNTSNVTNMSYMFHNCNNLTSLDVSNFDTSNVTNMDNMFYNCTNLISLDVSNWNTSKVTNMSGMFANCNSLTSLDVSNWNTSKVTRIDNMFSGCSKLTSLDVSNWDTSNVTDMDDVFNFCHLLKNVDVSNWDTSNVQYVNGMFGRCKQMTMIDISNFDMSAIKTSNVANYFHMFVDIPNVKTLIFGNNKFPDNINFIELFGLNRENVHLSSLEKVIVLEENTVNKLTDILPDRSSKSNSGVIVTNAEISDEAISTISSKNWSIRKMVAQYRYDANTYENLIPEFNTEFSSDKYEIHDSVSEIVIDNIRWEDGYLNADGVRPEVNTIHTNYYSVLPNVKYNFSEVLNCLWYDGDKRFIEGANSAPNYLSPSNAKYVRFCKANNGKISIISAKLITRSIESVNGDLPTLMRFGRVYVISESTTDSRTDSLLKVLDMNTSELIDCSSMFRYNTNLTSISCNWDTDNVTSMYGMFNYCHSLTSLDLNNFNTSNVSDMGYMFSTCNKLTSLDVSNWNTSKVTTMQYMFYNCSELTSLNISNWNTGEVASMSNMFYNCSELTSLDVSNFITSNVTDMQNMFTHCFKLTSLDVSKWDTRKVINMAGTFNNCNSLTSLDVSNWNTGKVTDMTHMFDACRSLTSLDVSNFDTSKVTNMNYMFYDCNSLTSLDVSNFDTSNVNDMSYMFYYCQSLTSLDLSNFDTSKVTNMYAMFRDCNSLTSLDVSNFNTSNVTGMSFMFYNCGKLTSLDVSNWDVSKVNMVQCTFTHTIIDRLDLSNWNFANLKSFTYDADILKGFIDSLRLLKTLDLPNYDLTILENFNNNFTNFIYNVPELQYIRCKNLNNLNIALEFFPDRTGKEQGKLITTEEILNQLTSEQLENLSTKNWIVTTETVKVAEYVYGPDIWASVIPEFNAEFISYFIDDEEIEGEAVDSTVKTLIKRTIWSLGGLPTKMQFGKSEGWDRGYALINLIYAKVDELTTMDKMFDTCINMVSCNTEGWNTSNVINMFAMFCNCQSLTSLNVSNFNTSNVTDMGYMFNNCNKLISLDVSNWNTSNVISMGIMFWDCQSLTSLDVSNWNTSKVTNMSYMFWNCYNLTSLDVSNWDTSNVIFMNHMFVRCKSLTSLDLSNFDTSNVTSMDSMFWECKSLTSLDVSNFNTDNVIYMGSMFINCTSLTSIDVSNFDTSNVTNMDYMFYDCNNLQEVKLGENFKMSSTCNTDEFATNCPATFLYPDTKTYWLDEPLRKGDIIYSGTSVNRKMAQITFDGSEDENWETSDYYFETYLSHLTRPKQSANLTSMCDKIPYVHYSILDKHQGYGFNHSYSLRFNLKDCDITSGATLDDWKVWLQQNPITVVYELDVPVTTKLDDEKIYLDTRENCTIETDSNVPVQNITFIGFRHQIPLLKPNTTYRISFISDNEIPWNSSTESIWLGGVTNYIPTVIKKGYNTFLVETPSILTNHNFSISRQGFNISNVMITEGEEEHKEYFEGFCSSFEMERNTDENDINYGKYKVEVKTTGKNLFDGILRKGRIENTTGIVYGSNKTTSVYSVNYIKVSPNMTITIHNDMDYNNYIYEYDEDKNFIKYSSNRINPATVTLSNNTKYILFRSTNKEAQDDLNVKYQVEEGTVATAYEPYKGTTKTLWLDEPLYRGDMIYTTTNNDDNPKQIWLQQRMQKYVINGNETWELLRTEQGDVPSITDTTTYLECKMMLSYNQIPLGSSGLNTNDINDKGFATANSGNIERFYIDGDYAYLVIKKERLSIADPSGVKTWFKNNPMTILYTKVSDDLIKLSDETLYLDTCENCSLGVESAVRVNRITTKNFVEAGLEMLKPNTKYLVKFKSDKEGVCRTFNLGGTAIESVNIVKGWNIVEITTPNEVSDSLAIRGQGFNISEVIITEYSDLMRDCEYFEGIGSSFEMKRTKNLFDFENATVRFVNYMNNSLYYDEMYVDVPPENSYSRLLFGKLNVSEIGNKKLFFKCEGYQCACSCFNKDNKLISDGGWMNENSCLTDYTVENTEYIAVYLRRIDEPEGFLNSEDVNFIKKNAIYTYANSFEEIEYEPYGYKVKIETTSIVSANDIISKLQM